jgi:hypothetical protein
MTPEEISAQSILTPSIVTQRIVTQHIFSTKRSHPNALSPQEICHPEEGDSPPKDLTNAEPGSAAAKIAYAPSPRSFFWLLNCLKK